MPNRAFKRRPGSNKNGTGNLIIGYAELRNDGTDDRTGSHNLVIGQLNNYAGWGGIVAGSLNSITGAYACVEGGFANTASGDHSLVSGGVQNLASGFGSSVSGGLANIAGGVNTGGDYTSILGGNAISVTTQFGHFP